jgi:hypothetical protein
LLVFAVTVTVPALHAQDAKYVCPVSLAKQIGVFANGARALAVQVVELTIPQYPA